MNVLLGNVKHSRYQFYVQVDRPVIPPPTLSHDWWEPPPPPSFDSHCYWPTETRFVVIIPQYPTSLSHGLWQSDWFSLVSTINFNISLLHLPTRKSKQTLILDCPSACFWLGPLASQSCFLILIWASLAIRQLVQQPEWLSGEPSNLSGWDQGDPPWPMQYVPWVPSQPLFLLAVFIKPVSFKNNGSFIHYIVSTVYLHGALHWHSSVSFQDSIVIQICLSNCFVIDYY